MENFYIKQDLFTVFEDFLFLCKVSENGLKYSRIGKCSGHSSFISKIDWSTDSEYLMSNSGDYEVTQN